MHYVAQCGSESRTIDLLLDHGADIQVASSTKETPLYLAVRYGHTEKAAELLDRGAKTDVTDAFGNSLVRVAIKFSYREMALLLSDRVEPTISDNIIIERATEAGLLWVVEAPLKKTSERGVEV